MGKAERKAHTRAKKQLLLINETLIHYLPTLGSALHMQSQCHQTWPDYKQGYNCTWFLALWVYVVSSAVEVSYLGALLWVVDDVPPLHLFYLKSGVCCQGPKGIRRDSGLAKPLPLASFSQTGNIKLESSEHIYPNYRLSSSAASWEKQSFQRIYVLSAGPIYIYIYIRPEHKCRI